MEVQNGWRRALRSDAVLYAGVAAVALLPFTRGLLSGSVFYFRDLSTQFFPLRSWAASALARGEFAGWNPHLNEGLALPVLWYPGDALLALAPESLWFLSLLLALHVPLAATAMAWLARRLGLGRSGAAAAALSYALGGFALSSLNLYLFLQALAWAPFAIGLLLGAADGPWRRVAAAGVVTGVLLSTLGVELAAQTMLVGLVLAGRPALARWSRFATAAALGIALATPLLFTTVSSLQESGRSAGFDLDLALAFSVRPIVLVQSVVAGFFGPPETLSVVFYGQRFTDGLPYILSLYLGATVLALAAVGGWLGALGRRRLVVMGVLGLLVSLGPAVRLDLLLEAIPALRALRFPVKAWYTVHLCVSLLCGAGLDALARSARPWKLAGGLALALGLPLAAAPTLLLAPSLSRDFWVWLLPPLVDVTAVSTEILLDASRGGLIASLLGGLLLVAAAGRVRRELALGAAPVLVAVDLLRAGAGLNPMMPAELLEPTSSARARAEELRASGGRVFTCSPEASGRLMAISRSRDDLDVFHIRARAEALTPATNVWLAVPTSFGRDTTGMVPQHRTFTSFRERGCTEPAGILDRLRAAATSRVISFEPLEAPGLARLHVAQPESVSPLRLWIYAVEDARPLLEVAARVVTGSREPTAGVTSVEDPRQSAEGVTGRVLRSQRVGAQRLSLEVEADRATVVVVREAWAAGWSARVDGEPAPVLRADGRHLAVPIAAGSSRVELRYRPPGLTTGLGLAGAAAALVAALSLAPLRRRPRRRQRDDRQAQDPPR